MEKKMVTAEFLWEQHRAVLGGRSSISGAPIPEKLADCPPGPQGAHWGMAVAIADLLGLDEPPLPPGVTTEEAERIRRVLPIHPTVKA